MFPFGRFVTTVIFWKLVSPFSLLLKKTEVGVQYMYPSAEKSNYANPQHASGSEAESSFIRKKYSGKTFFSPFSAMYALYRTLFVSSSLTGIWKHLERAKQKSVSIWACSP
jgi:hypothetical protein